jgi:hypothetical protein
MFGSQRSPETSNVSYRYRVYGLNVRSDLPLPELHPDEVRGEVDVDIRLGSIPAADEDGLDFGPDGAVLRIKNIAAFHMRDGREIVVEPCPGASERNVRLYLLGSAMGLALHQRGLLPLHANAIEICGMAVVFMGESGAGKSTLAAWAHDAGHRVIADDICVLRFDGVRDRIRVHPGLRRIRLWKDALEHSGREPGEYEYSYAGDETYEKFDVPVASEKSPAEELDLAAIYLLDGGDEFAIKPLTGVEALEAVFLHTYRGFAVSRLGRNRLHFDSSVQVVCHTPIFRLERSRALTNMATDVPKIIEHAKRVIGA